MNIGWYGGHADQTGNATLKPQCDVVMGHVACRACVIVCCDYEEYCLDRGPGDCVIENVTACCDCSIGEFSPDVSAYNCTPIGP